MQIVKREDWGAKPAESVTPWNPDDLFGIAYHHFAIPRASEDHAGCAAQMRGVQASHQAGEFNDIAYNFCVCQHGVVFEARGWNRQTGANGFPEVNQHWLAVCYMGDSDLDGFPEKAQDASAALFAEAFQRGVNRDVVPHRRFTGSECPGEKAHAWVVGDGWKKDLPVVTQVRFELWDDSDRFAESIWVPVAQSEQRLARFLENHHDLLHSHLASEGKTGDVRLIRRKK